MSEVIGQTLPCGPEGTTAYSPWFPGEGDSATFVCDTIGIGTKVLLDITVQHKNHGETDAQSTTAGSFSQINSIGQTSLRVTGMKEMVRYKFDGLLDDDAPPEWVHFRMLWPSWEASKETTTASFST